MTELEGGERANMMLFLCIANQPCLVTTSTDSSLHSVPLTACSTHLLTVFTHPNDILNGSLTDSLPVAYGGGCNDAAGSGEWYDDTVRYS